MADATYARDWPRFTASVGEGRGPLDSIPNCRGVPFVLWGLSARNAAPVGRRNPFRWSDHFMRKVSYLVSLVGLLLVFTVKIGQAHSDAMRRRRMQRIWAHKRDEWLRNLPA